MSPVCGIFFPSIQLDALVQLFIKKAPPEMFEINLIMFRPHLEFIDVFGFLIDTKNNAEPKLDVVMWCQIFYKKSVAPSGGVFCRRPAPQ